MDSHFIRNGNHVFGAWRDSPAYPFKIALKRAHRNPIFHGARARYTEDYVWLLARRWDRLHTARRAYLADRNAALDELYAEYDDYRAHQSDGLPL